MQFSTWFKFKVLSLNSEAFKRAADELAQLARGFEPNVIIGIRTGGYELAALVKTSLPVAELLPVTCRRPGTEGKNKFSIVKAMLCILPHFITDRLRIAEHIMLTQLRTVETIMPSLDTQELAAIERCLAKYGASAKVLIIDDAVDRGATLKAVRNTINSIANPAAVIKMAAITVTTAAPLIEPDFSLYRYVLCRFPWSLDAKN